MLFDWLKRNVVTLAIFSTSFMGFGLAGWVITDSLQARSYAVETIVERQFAANFSADILGTPDTRPDTWGTAGYQAWTIQFKNVPALHRVRIVRVFGDVISYVRDKSNRTAGTLFGLATTAPDGNIGMDSIQRCDFCALNTMLYVQDFVGPHGGGGLRTFDNVVSAGGLLEPDHKLLVKVAAWLNETGQPIHIEPTINVVYKYEPAVGVN